MRHAAAIIPLLVSVTAYATDYGPLCASVKRATAKKELRVAYLGASISCGERASVKDRLSYTALTNAALGAALRLRVDQYNACVGSAQSSLGLALLKQVILPWSPDLIFVEYGVLDEARELPSVPATEQILRIALAKEIPVVLVAVATRDTDHTSRSWMLFLSSYYGVPIADQRRFLDRKGIPYGRTSGDGTHPNDFGHQTLADSIVEALASGLEIRTCPPQQPLPPLYSTLDYSGLQFAPPVRTVGARTVPQTVFVKASPAIVIGKQEGPIDFRFSGPVLQVLFTNGRTPPGFTYALDGGPQKKVMSAKWRQHHVLESELGNGAHRVILRFPPSLQEVVLEGFLVTGR